MALPLLGLNVRLKGAAAKQYTVRYSATFIDGSAVGPVEEGVACEAPGLAAMESFLIELGTRSERSYGPAASRQPRRIAPPKLPRRSAPRASAPKSPGAVRAAVVRSGATDLA